MYLRPLQLLAVALFCLCLSTSLTGAAQARTSLEEFISLGLGLSNNSEMKRLQTAAHFHIFSQPKEVSEAFIENLVQNPSEERLFHLAEALGNNEANLIKAMDLLYEKVVGDPRLLAEVERSLEWFEARLKQRKVEAGAFVSRLYEIGLLSASYMGLLYSVQGYFPELITYGGEMTQSPIPFITLLAVAIRREYMGMREGFRSYLRRLKSQKGAAQFVRRFSDNLQVVKRLGTHPALLVGIEASRYTVLSSETQNKAKQLVEDYVIALEALKAAGLYTKFINFLNSRRMQKELALMTHRFAKIDPQLLKGLSPEEMKLVFNPKGPLSYRAYRGFRDQIRLWLESNSANNLVELEIAARNSLDQFDKQKVEGTRLSFIDRISIETLTMGSLAVSLALGIGSTSVAFFDSYIPADLLHFLRHEKAMVATTVLFLPVFTLFYIEGSTIFSKVARPGRRAARATDSQVRSNILDLLASIDLYRLSQDKDLGLRMSSVGTQGLRAYSVSSQRFVEMLSRHQLLETYAPSCRSLFAP